MITYITGQVIHTELKDTYTSVEVLTASGVAYEVFIPSNISVVTGDNAEFYTNFQVREDSQSLYGFSSREHRSVFASLIGVSGVGPKIGIAVLSTYTAHELREILEAGDFKKLSKVSGLGEKGSKKIILDLQGKLELGSTSDEKESQMIKELKAALQSLGYKGDDMKLMVEKGEKLIDEGVDMIEELVQKVLKSR